MVVVITYHRRRNRLHPVVDTAAQDSLDALANQGQLQLVYLPDTFLFQLHFGVSM